MKYKDIFKSYSIDLIIKSNEKNIIYIYIWIYISIEKLNTLNFYGTFNM